MDSKRQDTIINTFFIGMIIFIILVFSIKNINKPDVIVDHIQEKWLIESLNEIIIQTPYGFKTYKYLKNSMVIIEQEKDIFEKTKIIKLKVMTVKQNE